MKTNNRIWLLMGRRLSGDITEKEVEELNGYFQVNENLTVVMDLLLRPKNVSEKQSDNQDIKMRCSRLLNRIKK